MIRLLAIKIASPLDRVSALKISHFWRAEARSALVGSGLSTARIRGGVLGHTVLPVAMLGAGETLGHALPGHHPVVAEQALQERVSTGVSTTNPHTWPEPLP